MAQFGVGTYVINHDTLGRVVEVRDDGLLILQNVRIGKWLADPQQCELYYLQGED